MPNEKAGKGKGRSRKDQYVSDSGESGAENVGEDQGKEKKKRKRSGDRKEKRERKQKKSGAGGRRRKVSLKFLVFTLLLQFIVIAF